MKYTLLYIYIAAGMLAMTSCSNDDDMPVAGETPQAAKAPEDALKPISWLSRAYSPEDIKAVEDDISAIRGAGYTYRENDNYSIGTDMEVFNTRNLRALGNKYRATFIIDDYNPASDQKFFYSTSVKALKDSLSGDIGIGFGAGMFSVDVDVAFNKQSSSTQKKYYSMLRLKQSYFSRDLNYMDLRALVADAIANSSVANTYVSIDANSLAKVVPMFKEVYAPGFADVMQKFVQKVHSAQSAYTASGYCREFIEEIGSGFVKRSVLGCSLDYYNTTVSDSVSSSLDVKVALELSVQIKFVNIRTSISADYKDAAEKCNRNSESHITARGGNVSLVTAFTTGQEAKIDSLTLKQWQATVTPKDAALIDIRLVPIYEVIYDAKARNILRSYMDKSLRNYEDD